MTSASIGFGTQFKRGDGATPTEGFTAIAEVTKINGFDMKKDTVDGTHMGSPSRFREFISGLRDAGDISIEMNWKPNSTDVQSHWTDFQADTSKNYQIVWPDGTKFQFPGIANGFSSVQPMDDKMTGTFNYKIAGKPTFTFAP